MRIGIIKEIKEKENRVAATSDYVKQLVDAGHAVTVEKGAGVNSGFADEEYVAAGATLGLTEEAWGADLVIKVKEPMESEYHFFRENQLIFTYFHLAGVTKTLTDALLKSKATSIAYETVEDKNGKLPLLAPMSGVAGNMSITMGAYHLAKFVGGRGMQLGTVLGEKYGKVVVIGDGIAGKHAARTAVALGTDVYLFTRHEDRFISLKKELGVTPVLSNPKSIAEHVKDADLVVGAVLLHGAKAPRVVTEDMVKTMVPGSVIVDISIDQGGCIETSKPTSHTTPTFVKNDVIHYCVTNMPGAYPRTSTIALTAATLPYALKLAAKGIGAVNGDAGLAKGVNTKNGFITYKPVADALGMMDKFKELNELL